MQQNRFFSHLYLQNFHGGDPLKPQLPEGDLPPHVLSPPLVPSALGERRRRSMAVPLSKSRRRPWTYFNTYTMNIRINSAVTAILMTSLFNPKADLRCVNWIKSLLMAQRLIWYSSQKSVTKFTLGQILSFSTYATMWLMPYAHRQDGLLHFKVEFCVNCVSV